MEPLSTKMSRDTERISFHPEQLKWLEKMFPEHIATPSSTVPEMYWRGGTRAVLDAVRSNIRK